MNGKEKLRIAIAGTSKRSEYMYFPILREFSDSVELVSVWGRSEGSARRLGEALGVPWYLNMDKLTRETSPDIAIVSVAKSGNGEVGLMAVEAGLHVLLETPIALDLEDADKIISAADTKGLKIEVAEQFHRRPAEQIKLKLIGSGIFGKVYSSFNDFGGHAYHGMSMMRSYLGFNAVPVSLTAISADHELAPHYSRISGSRDARTETQQHAMIQFEGGRIGIFHWTSVGYDSELRWWRSSRFLAEKGMGISVGDAVHQEDILTVLAPGGEGRQRISLERRWERIDGGPLESIVAHTGQPDNPIVKWTSPLYRKPAGKTIQWHDDEIAVASCFLSLIEAVRNNTQPDYGARQARLDQELNLALQLSAQEKGKTARLPLRGPDSK